MPLTRRQIYLRRRIAVFGGLAALLGAGFYLPTTLLAPIPPVRADILPYTSPTSAAATVALPAYGASGVGAVGFPGALASTGPAIPLPIASITKVVTALVVLEAHPLAPGEVGPTITFTAADEQFYRDQLARNGSVAAVRSGQSMTQHDLLEIMLVGSANNYSDSLVTWAFGSSEVFLEAARAWLAAKGLASTTISDASGIEPTNTSTVTDLLALAKLAIAHPVVAQIAASPRAEVPGLGAIANTNKLLGVDGIDGIKTGTLDEAGSCLLFSADYLVGSESVTVVGVVLGGPDHATIDAHIRGLLAETLAGFHEVTLVSAGDEFASYETDWGATADAVASRNEKLVLWGETPVSVLVQSDQLGTADKGAVVGEVTFQVGERSLTVDLQLDAALEDPGPWWRLTNPAGLF